MKKLYVIFVIFFTAAALAATEPGTDDRQRQGQGQEEKAKPTGEVTLPVTERDKEWPRPFVPSEQIGADTVVTFPADI